MEDKTQDIVAVPRWAFTLFGIAQPFIVAAVVALFTWIINVERELTIETGQIASIKEARDIIAAAAAAERAEIKANIRELAASRETMLTTLSDILARVKNIEHVQDGRGR